MNNIETSSPILTIYLSSTEKRPPYFSYFVSQLHSLVHRDLSEVEKRKWKNDIEKIEDYLHEFLNRSDVRSLVFFTSGKNFWKVLEFEFSLPLLCKISNTPYLKPLREASEKHQRYLSLLVDREKARLFTVHLGKIEEQKDILIELVPQNVKAKKIDWGRDDKIFRHIEDHLHRHLQLIAKAAKDFLKNKGIQLVIVGGDAEMIPKIKKHLLYPLDKMVRGQFITELNIPLSGLLRHSKKIASYINEENKNENNYNGSGWKRFP